MVNGKTDNLVSVEFDGGGDVTTPLWVTIAFTSGATFTQTAPDHDWRCSPWTTGLGKPFTSAVACEYVGTTPDDPGNLVYDLAVNLPRPAGYIYALFCGSSTPGDFDNDSCTVPWIYMPVMRAT